MSNKLKQCPKCGSTIKSIMANGRMMQDTCKGDNDEYIYNSCGDQAGYASYCGWTGQLYKPTKKAIKTIKTVSYFKGGSWHFETYDKYGGIICHSQDYANKKMCINACKKELATYILPGYEGCTGIVWEPTAQVKGIKVK